MNIHVNPASGIAESYPVAEPLDTARKFYVGEIVAQYDRLAVVLPCNASKGKKFFRFMHSEEIDGEYRSRIFHSLRSESFTIRKLDGVTPTLELEESGCHLHALLTTTEAGEVIREFVDLRSFEATLTGWYEVLRSIPTGSLDVLRNVLDGSPASDRLLKAYERLLEAHENAA
jgi:hypothetical protein